MKLFSRTITFNEKEFQAELAQIEDLVHELRTALEEALDWIERPVATQEDAAYFELFQVRALALLR